MLDEQSKVRFLSILNGARPGHVHGSMYLHVGKADVIAMTKEGLIDCEHPEEWGGEYAWPAPEISITDKGRKWLNDHSRLVTFTVQQRILPGDPVPEDDKYFG